MKCTCQYELQTVTNQNTTTVAIGIVRLLQVGILKNLYGRLRQNLKTQKIAKVKYPILVNQSLDGIFLKLDYIAPNLKVIISHTE